MTIIATLLLTVSALTQDEFSVYEEPVEESKDDGSGALQNEEQVGNEVIIYDANSITSEKESEVYSEDSNERKYYKTVEPEEVAQIEESSAMEQFRDLIKQKQEAEISLYTLKQIAKETYTETPEISKKTKQIAIAEVSRKAITSERVDIIVWVKKDYSYKHVMRSLRNFHVKEVYGKVNGFSGSATRNTINLLKRDNRVDYIAFDAPIKASLEESVPLIKADIARSIYGVSGEGLGICHLDSGINYNIPELAAAYAGGYDFVNNDSDPFDDNGHGTITAGVLVSSDPINAGISPNAKLYAVKVLNSSGFGFTSSVTAGINWCIANKDILNISVISMSIATFETYDRVNSPGYSDVALQAAYNENMPIVACTGNTGNKTGVAYPAVSPYVIPVTGVYDSDIGPFSYQFNTFSCSDNVTNTDKIACFANRAPFVELAAPASIITTTSWFGGTMDVSGTSAASPHVAATITLMKERNPEMTVEQIKEILVSTGVQVNDPASGLSFKRINALRAIEAVPYITATGTLASGNIMTLEVSDPMNPGQLYFAVLGFGNDVGIPLSNGLTLPINADGLFTYSLSPNPLIINNIGFLNSTGGATAIVNIPPIPGIENFTLYSGFATARTDLSEFLSVSNSDQL